MKLLFLTEFYPRDKHLVFTGGVEARVYYISRAAEKDFRVQIIASSSRHIPATPISVISRLWFILKSFYLALIADFDLLEASNVVTYLPAFFAAKLKGKPVIAWIPDVLAGHWWEFGPVVGFSGLLAENICLKLPWDRVIALSDSTARKLIKRGVTMRKISVVHAGIDPREFEFARPRQFSQFTVICVARLVKTKRIDQLIQAAAKLPLQLIVVGFGPQEARLKRLAGGKVKFYKNLQRRELLQLISRCHLFCLPSVVEGFGIATIEAMACGLPAVLADIPVNREITRNGQGAVFFNNDLAEKIMEIRQNYKQKQVEALALAKNYAWDKVYAQTKKVYETCLHY